MSVHIKDSELGARVKSWQRGDGMVHLVCAIDVGGTHTRVVLGNCGGKESVELPKLMSSQVSELIKHWRAVGKAVQAAGGTVVSTCICLAGRILDGGTKVDLTNFKGDRILTKEMLPTSLFPTNLTRFTNDLEAASYGIVSLAQHGDLHRFFQPLWLAQGEKEAKEINLQPNQYTVAAMGTGLGMATLLAPKPHAASQHHEVLAMEAGHALVPRPGTRYALYQQDVALQEYVSAELYDSQQGMEYEDVCSGRGLELCFRYVSGGKKAGAGDVAKAAQAGDEAAVTAMTLHYRYLFKAVQNLAVSTLAKGVFLAGDNQVHNDWFVTKHIDVWRSEFMNHPKASWLSDVSVYRQIRELNINLRGCEFVARTSVHASP